MQHNVDSVFHKYEEYEKNQALYIHFYNSFGLYYKLYHSIFSSNTYTFIYENKSNCAMFIAPLKNIKLYKIPFLDYNHYLIAKKNQNEYIKNYFNDNFLEAYTKKNNYDDIDYVSNCLKNIPEGYL